MEKAKEFQKNIYFCFIDYAKAFDFVDHNKLWKFLKRWKILKYQTTLPAWEICMQDKKQQLELDMGGAQLCSVAKKKKRTGHGTTDWFQIGKGVHQGCTLSPCLFNLYAEYLMRNAGLDEAQAGIKVAGRNINNLRYSDDTTLMAERMN